MGQNSILNQEQKLILQEFSQNDFLLANFYFTGGTALSEVYFQHRESVDLDFFTPGTYDPQLILNLISNWSRSHNFTFEAQFVEPTQIYILSFKNGRKLKVDFGPYPYKSLAEKTSYQKIKVDSKLDIAANKLALISSQRSEVKDFVDLYFLLQEFSLWDLVECVKTKFNFHIEPFILASDFLTVEEFDFLPLMLKPLTLPQLKNFFTKKAEKLGKSKVE